MTPVVAIILATLTGASLMVTGTYLVLGTGFAMILAGIFCIILAYMLGRGSRPATSAQQATVE